MLNIKKGVTVIVAFYIDFLYIIYVNKNIIININMTEQLIETKKETTINDNDLEFKLQEVERMSNEYALSGEYDKAKECKKQIVILQAKLKEKKKQDLEQQHLSEMETLEQSYQEEIESFNLAWSAKLTDLEERSQKAEDAINERQLKEMEELYATIEDKLPKKVKYSKEYLFLDHQEKMLVKLQKFDEAKVIKKKKEQQKKIDEEKWEKEKNEKIKVQAVKKSKKHIAEKNVLKKKFETELDIMRKEKEKEIAQIEKKYLAKKLELELQQKSESILNANEKMLKKRQIGMNYFMETTKHTRINTQGNTPSQQQECINHREVNLEDDLDDDKNNINTITNSENKQQNDNKEEQAIETKEEIAK